MEVSQHFTKDLPLRKQEDLKQFIMTSPAFQNIKQKEEQEKLRLMSAYDQALTR